MKLDYIKIIYTAIVFFNLLSQQIYSKDSLLVDTNDYRLFYVGRTATLAELKNKFISLTTFVNIPIDSSFYKAEYPNPFSPSVYKSSFIYRLTDKTDIKINIIDTQDSIIYNLNFNDQIEGYYYFIIKSECFEKYSLYNKILSSFENIRINFMIEDEEFIFLISNNNFK
jgi:hypothetical protein